MIFSLLKRLSNNLRQWKNKKAGRIAIDTEVIFSDSVWDEVKKTVENSKMDLTWFCLTPVNYEFAISEFNYKGTKKQYEEILLKRYKYLKDHGQKIELHVHLSMVLQNMTYKEKLEKIGGAVKWMKKHGFNITRFIPGWYSYDKETLEILKKFGLRFVERGKIYYHTHDFEFLSPYNAKLY